MKKLIILTLCTMMTVTMAACGRTSSARTQQIDNAESNSATDESIAGSKVQIINPFVECATLEEAAELAGFTFTVPDAVEGYAYRRIFVIENDLFEVTYTNDEESDEKNSEETNYEFIDYEYEDFCIRKGAKSENISGDYNEYSETGIISVSDLQVITKGNDGKVNVALWTDRDYSFAIVAGNALTVDVLQEFITKIK